MRAINSWLVRFMSVLCRLFYVTPDGLGKGRRGNLPPETGGLANY